MSNFWSPQDHLRDINELTVEQRLARVEKILAGTNVKRGDERLDRIEEQANKAASRAEQALSLAQLALKRTGQEPPETPRHQKPSEGADEPIGVEPPPGMDEWLFQPGERVYDALTGAGPWVTLRPQEWPEGTKWLLRSPQGDLLVKDEAELTEFKPPTNLEVRAARFGRLWRRAGGPVAARVLVISTALAGALAAGVALAHL